MYPHAAVDFVNSLDTVKLSALPLARHPVFRPAIGLKAAVVPLLLMLACAGGCAPLTARDSGPQILDAQAAPRFYQRDWNMKGLTAEGREIVIDVDTKISIRFAPGGQVSGHAGVNRFSGTYNLSAEGKLSWGAAGFAATRNTGPPELMEKERAFLRALGRTSAAILARHALVLQSDDASTVLTFYEAGY